MENGPIAAKRAKVSHLPQNLYLPNGIESSVMIREWWVITHYSSVIGEIYGLSFWTDIIDKSPIIADLWFQKTFIGHKLWLFLQYSTVALFGNYHFRSNWSRRTPHEFSRQIVWNNFFWINFAVSVSPEVNRKRDISFIWTERLWWTRSW